MRALIRGYRQRLLGDIASCDELLAQPSFLAGEISIADLMLYAIVGNMTEGPSSARVSISLGSWIGRACTRPAVRTAEAKCPYAYDVSATLGDEPYDPELAVEGFRPIA
jgi:glutathione S-transferase